MIKILTAFTEEIDDTRAAVDDILGQLDWDTERLKNSLGILHCYTEFIDSGIVKAISEKLPFDVVGATTMSIASPGGLSQVGLSLTVLTSDTVSFAAGVSAPITDTVDGPVEELYQKIAAGFPERPAMLMPFIPFLTNVGGDEFIEKIDSLSGGIPAFGTLSISNDLEYKEIYTFYNGQAYHQSLVLAALIGDVDPVFLSVSVSDENILKQKAVITGVNRNTLTGINNMSAMQYMESIGIAKNGGLAGMESMPFIVYLDDGSRLIRCCIGSAPGGGVVLCGAVPVNTTLALSTMEPKDVIDSTAEKVREALTAAQGRGLLMYSCAARYWAQGMQLTAEQEKVRECIGDTAPYHFVYSGGEIFPEFLSNGRVVNRLQNDSLIICML
jgi:hypothetical protein